MKRGNFYSHPSCRDICMQVISSFTVPEHETIKVKVLWWRLRFGKIAYCIGITQKFEKPIEYWKQWKTIKETESVNV